MLIYSMDPSEAFEENKGESWITVPRLQQGAIVNASARL